MTLDPNSLVTTPDLLERIEMASLRLVAQALYEFKKDAVQIFAIEQDRVKTIGEDITREAMDRLSTSVIPIRLSGDVDYKRARFYFTQIFRSGRLCSSIPRLKRAHQTWLEFRLAKPQCLSAT